MTIPADKYYGRYATNYDASRNRTERWAKEQEAVAEFVTIGKVLDVPIGTARYVSIYRKKGLDCIGLDISGDMLAEAKKKFPDMQLDQGSILDLPYSDKSFGTVVCSRMLDWFNPADMAQAVSEMRRVAHELIVTLRHGPEEVVRVNQTHTLHNFLKQLDGLMICGRRVTEVTQDGTEEIFRFKAATWEDVLKQFSYNGKDPAQEVNRLAGVWFKDIVVNTKTTEVKAEYWTGTKLKKVLEEMSAVYDHADLPNKKRYITDDRPRFETTAPATILKAKGEFVILDGRRRINEWCEQPGLHPVLVLTHRGNRAR